MNDYDDDPREQTLIWHLRCLWSWFKWNYLGGRRRYGKWLSKQLRGEYQKYFDEKLLKHATELLVMDQFAEMKPFPKDEQTTR